MPIFPQEERSPCKVLVCDIGNVTLIKVYLCWALINLMLNNRTLKIGDQIDFIFCLGKDSAVPRSRVMVVRCCGEVHLSAYTLGKLSV